MNRLNMCLKFTCSTSNHDDYEAYVCSSCQHRPVNITAVITIVMDPDANARQRLKQNISFTQS